jgi:hypothetical protein
VMIQHFLPMLDFSKYTWNLTVIFTSSHINQWIVPAATIGWIGDLTASSFDVICVLFTFDVSCFHTAAQEHQQVCEQTSKTSALGFWESLNAFCPGLGCGVVSP